MAIIGSIALRMSANPGPLKRDLGQASSAVASFSSQVVKTSTLVKGAFGAAIGAAGALAIGKMVKSSSDLAENVGKIGAIFGEQGKSVEADARQMADAFGVSLNGMLDSAGKLGGLFKGAGFGDAEVAGLSKQFNRLALDASRFFNVPFDVAFQKIRSGLAGEAEPLRDFGVFLTADKIKAEALALGVAKAGEDISDTAKIAASASLITKGLADAQGNAAETAGGTAAQIESLSGRFENLITTLGEGLSPIAGRVLGGINTSIAAITAMWDQSKESIFGWTGSLGGALTSVNLVEVAVGSLATAWQGVSLAFQSGQLVFQEVFNVLVSGAAEFAKVWDDVAEAIFGTSTGIGKRLGGFSDALKDELSEARRAFAAEMAKPWAFKAVGEQFEAVRNKVKDFQAEAARTPNAVASLAGKVLGGGEGGESSSKSKSSKVFGEALRLGSVEAASAILRSRYGSGGDKDQTAKNTKDTADGVKESVAVLKDIHKAVAKGPTLVPLSL